jgi:PAS domain S-box-containing protein
MTLDNERQPANGTDTALADERVVNGHVMQAPEHESADAAREQAKGLIAELSATQDRYRTLFEESRDAIYITAADGQFIDGNPALLELLGYERIDLLQLNARDFYVHPAEREAFRVLMDGQGYVRDHELGLRRRDGKTIDCLISAIARRDESGAIIEYQGMIHDITDRKRAQLRLMESEHFTRAIISSVRQGIVVFDRELRYRLWNGYMEEITGIRAKEVLGANAIESLPLLHDRELTALLRRALAGESVQAADTRFHIVRTGRMGWISTVFTPNVSATGEVIGVVAIVHDITERKQVEQQLVHNAFHDALTHLPNRALFMDRLERLLSHSRRHR